MITCKELVDFLMDYVENDLPPEQRAEFERHLAVCPRPPCVAYLESYRETIALGRAAMTSPGPQASEAVPEELVQAILAARAKGQA